MGDGRLGGGAAPSKYAPETRSMAAWNSQTINTTNSQTNLPARLKKKLCIVVPFVGLVFVVSYFSFFDGGRLDIAAVQ